MADEPNIQPVTTEADADAGGTPPVADVSSTILTDDKNSDVTPPTGDVVKDGDPKPDVSKDADTGDQSKPLETYADFTFPDGIELDASLLESAAPIFKELGLTQEQAQKLVTFQAEQVQAGTQRQNDAFTQLVDGWRDQSVNDKEFGGDNFDESVGIARQAIDKFGTPELKQLLEDHGVGNHPEVIRMMVKVGKLTLEDVPGGGKASGGPTDRVSILYPDSKTA